MRVNRVVCGSIPHTRTKVVNLEFIGRGIVSRLFKEKKSWKKA